MSSYTDSDFDNLNDIIKDLNLRLCNSAKENNRLNEALTSINSLVYELSIKTRKFIRLGDDQKQAIIDLKHQAEEFAIEASKMKRENCKLLQHLRSISPYRLYRVYYDAVEGKSFNGDALPDPDKFFHNDQYKLQADVWYKVSDFVGVINEY